MKVKVLMVQGTILHSKQADLTVVPCIIFLSLVPALSIRAKNVLSQGIPSRSLHEHQFGLSLALSSTLRDCHVRTATRDHNLAEGFRSSSILFPMLDEYPPATLASKFDGPTFR